MEEEGSGAGDEGRRELWISKIIEEEILVPEDLGKVQSKRGLCEGRGESSEEENDEEAEPSN